MPDLPLPSQTDVTLQNQATGAIDFLKYEGSTLVASAMFDYGIGSDWKVVASEGLGAHAGLVVQSQSTGFLDFLGLDNSGNLVASVMSNVPAPHIAGLAPDYGHAFIGQLPDGEIDLLQFNASTGALTNSDLLPSTAGMPHVVGGGAVNVGASAFLGLTGPDEIVSQLADGSIDLLGLTGAFGSASINATLLLPGSAGTPTIGAVNQNDGFNYNVRDTANNIEGLQLIGQNGGGQPDVMYYDTGANNPANAGILYASNLLNTAFSGWSVVDGGYFAHAVLFPIS